MSGKIVQNVLIGHSCQQNRQFSAQYRRDCCALNTHNLLPLQGGKLSWACVSPMQLRNLPKYNRGIVYCNGPFQTLIIQVDIRCNHSFFRPLKNLESGKIDNSFKISPINPSYTFVAMMMKGFKKTPNARHTML